MKVQHFFIDYIQIKLYKILIIYYTTYYKTNYLTSTYIVLFYYIYIFFHIFGKKYYI